jgi:hypothetical protein
MSQSETNIKLQLKTSLSGGGTFVAEEKEPNGIRTVAECALHRPELRFRNVLSQLSVRPLFFASWNADHQFKKIGVTRR